VKYCHRFQWLEGYSQGYWSLKAEEYDVKATVINTPFPLKVGDKVLQEATETGVIVTYEDHNVNTGLGATVLQAIAEAGCSEV